MRLRVWYTDGRTGQRRVYRVTTVGGWKRLPKTGLLWATLYASTGRTYFNGADWYWLAGEWIERIPSGEWGTWAPRPDGCVHCIKRGDPVTDEEFARIEAEAMAATLWR